jgi:hypothetical protein
MQTPPPAQATAVPRVPCRRCSPAVATSPTTTDSSITTIALTYLPVALPSVADNMSMHTVCIHTVWNHPQAADEVTNMMDSILAAGGTMAEPTFDEPSRRKLRKGHKNGSKHYQEKDPYNDKNRMAVAPAGMLVAAGRKKQNKKTGKFGRVNSEAYDQNTEQHDEGVVRPIHRQGKTGAPDRFVVPGAGYQTVDDTPVKDPRMGSRH